MNARRFVLATLAALAAVATTACGNTPESRTEEPFARPSGYWEGSGKLLQIDMKDGMKELTRGAGYTFWFVLDARGEARGEIEVTWDALLRVDGLSQFSFTLPMPPAGVSISPKVGGYISDPDPKRKYALVGRLSDGELELEAKFGDEPKPILFSIKADPGVAGGGVRVYDMPMKPFPVFGEPATLEKRPHGPHAASLETNTDTLRLEWNAKQITTEERR